MSLTFNDITTRRGIIQSIERKLGFQPLDISASTSNMLDFTAEINIALDYIYSVIFKVGGTWQFDDQNHADYPIITRNLVSGQRDYPFTTDNLGNLILEVMRVFVKDSNGTFQEVFPVDVQSQNGTESFTNGLNQTGVPLRYDKTANGIIFDVVPSYSQTDGVKVYISREGSYFTTGDTTKKPGFAGLFHEFLPVRVAYKYAFGKSLPNVNISELKDEMNIIQKNIEAYYGRREKDVRAVMTSDSRSAYKNFI